VQHSIVGWLSATDDASFNSRLLIAKIKKYYAALVSGEHFMKNIRPVARWAKIILLSAWGSTAYAQSGTSTIQVKSGQPTTIRYIFNCDFIDFEVWPHGQQHGSVKTERYTTSRCHKENGPHIRVIYQSLPGYKGKDEVWIQASGGTRVQVRIIVE
jgi:hypothetical protein